MICPAGNGAWSSLRSVTRVCYSSSPRYQRRYQTTTAALPVTSAGQRLVLRYAGGRVGGTWSGARRWHTSTPRRLLWPHPAGGESPHRCEQEQHPAPIFRRGAGYLHPAEDSHAHRCCHDSSLVRVAHVSAMVHCHLQRGWLVGERRIPVNPSSATSSRVARSNAWSLDNEGFQSSAASFSINSGRTAPRKREPTMFANRKL